MNDVGPSQRRDSYAAALAASEGLRGALARLGIPERSYRSIRPAMPSTGRPYVYLGILNADAVEAITAVLLHELANPCLSEEQGADATARPTRRSRPAEVTLPLHANAPGRTEAGHGPQPSSATDAATPPCVPQCSCAQREERPEPVEQ